VALLLIIRLHLIVHHAIPEHHSPHLVNQHVLHALRDYIHLHRPPYPVNNVLQEHTVDLVRVFVLNVKSGVPKLLPELHHVCPVLLELLKTPKVKVCAQLVLLVVSVTPQRLQTAQYVP